MTYEGGVRSDDSEKDGRGSGIIYKLVKTPGESEGEYTYELKKLHDFGEGDDIGKSPVYAGLTLADDGFLYGTTLYTKGGTVHDPSNPDDTGHGTLFKIKPDGTGYQTVYVFRGAEPDSDVVDGSFPRTILSVGPDRKLYGTTAEGGDRGMGTVFNYDPVTQKYELIYKFRYDSLDAENPYWGVMFDDEKNMYGASAYGGNFWSGVIFKLTPEK